MCRLNSDSERRRIRVTQRESVLKGLVRGFPTRHFAMPPGLGPIERAVVVAHLTNLICTIIGTKIDPFFIGVEIGRAHV